MTTSGCPSTYRKSTMVIVALAMGGAAATGVHAIVERAPLFPHEEHDGLFPLCTGCHAGIETGVGAEIFPDEQTCLNCHDGVVEEAVAWVEPQSHPSNLRFSHLVHMERQQVAGEAWDCASCHGEGSRPDLMTVERASPEGCLTCHAHEAPSHLIESRDCAACHTVLPEARGLTEEVIAAFPQPASHLEPDFQGSHGTLAVEEGNSCAFCHSQESCTRCHANGAALPAVRALATDARVAAVVSETAPHYSEPATHLDSGWNELHGQLAIEEVSSCANCHTESSCRGCHTGVGPAALNTLPSLAEDDPRGVRVAVLAVHRSGFSGQHGAAAAAAAASCESCHTSDTCTTCHNGPGGGFHPVNFLQMHGPESYGRESDCTSCHSTEVFCRSCHVSTGMGPEGNLRVAFHSAQPGWLLGHGNAARQGLESCASCHRQVDCMQCHAAVGSWSINPHGPDFDGDRLSAKNVSSCNLCHRVGS
ncbi:MAG: hypothetical protein OEO23_02450 [Gemmatimonadota bacterium]|nr:hypothetical protein [Gemmatimonadota bacterium]